MAKGLRSDATSLTDYHNVKKLVENSFRPPTAEVGLEQAEHLLENKYKDAAAVLIGAALESTLRKICTRHSIAIAGYETIDPLNAKLAKQELYTKLVQKQITTWADIRNNAAHGHFDKYTKADVEDTDKWVRSFIEQQLT